MRRLPVLNVFKSRDDESRQAAAPSVPADPSPRLEDHRRSFERDAALAQVMLKAVLSDIETNRVAAQETGRALSSRLDDTARALSQLAGEGDNLSHFLSNMEQAWSAMRQEVCALSEQNQEMAEKAQIMLDLIADLPRSLEMFEAVEQTLSSVTRQTDLLALNATVEAARAGISGYGYTLLASQLKTISGDAGLLASQMRTRLQVLGKQSAHMDETISHLHQDVKDNANSLNRLREACAIQQQISVRLSDQAGRMGAMALETGTVLMETKTCCLEIGGGESLAGEAIKVAESLQRRVQATFQAQDQAALQAVYPVTLTVFLKTTIGGREAQSLAIREDGLTLQKIPFSTLGEGDRIEMQIETGPLLPVEIVHVGEESLEIRLLPCDTRSRSFFQEVFGRVQASYDPLVRRAQELAQDIASAMEKAEGVDWFAQDYRLVPQIRPYRFETPFLKAAEEIVPDRIDAALVSDPRLVFCIILDQNGYAPVHNRKFAQEPRPDDAEWNARHSLHRSLLDDAISLAAARSGRPFLIQSYTKDMGAGIQLPLREISAPIALSGRFWGSLRMAYKL